MNISLKTNSFNIPLEYKHLEKEMFEYLELFNTIIKNRKVEDYGLCLDANENISSFWINYVLNNCKHYKMEARELSNWKIVENWN